jgi:hypothetical protein
MLERGAHFHNVYSAQLDGCFTAGEEHRTQEVALPTKHLALRVHFPTERPPVLVRCKRVSGLADYQLKTGARITLLFGQPAIIWEITDPTLGDIFELEWRW